MWRYQSVVQSGSDPADVTLSLCEVYFDEHERLTKWSEPCMCPCGDDLDQLSSNLVQMLVDALSWEAVEYDHLKVGMAFTQRIAMQQREAVARLVESMVEHMKS